MISHRFSFLLAAAVVLGMAGSAQAQLTVYSQGFDNPTNANGDIYFTTNPDYNGITDGTSSNGITTGGSFAGNPTTTNGIISSGDAMYVPAPQSGPYFLFELTSPSIYDHTGTLFSTLGTSVPLLPNSTYRFSYYLASGNTAFEPEIQSSINGTILGTAIPTNGNGTFTQYAYTYNSGASTNAVIALNNLQPSGTGDDFGVDTIQLVLTNANLAMPGLDANQRSIANALSGAINPVSAAVILAYLNNPASLAGNLNQLSPLAFEQFTSETAFNNASYETEEMDNYLAGERDEHGNFLAGHGGIDSSGLTVNDPSYDPNLAMVHSRLLAWNPAPYGGTVSDIGGPLLGGVDMKDEKNMTSASGPAYTDPWNFFVRGNVILAQGFSNGDVSHFDDNTESVVLGTDYRVTNHLLVGLKAGYAHTDVTLDNNGSSATVDSYSPGFYASYADKGWYANLLGDYLHNAYTQSRVIGFLGQTATSAPEGNQGVANLDGGYDFHMGPFTLGPLAGLQYTHLSVDSYNESGSIADLSVNDSESDSLRSRLGGRISYTFSDCGINFTPHLDATWQHEFLDQSRGITSQFGFGGGSFAVRTINPSRDSALVDAGLDADLNRTVTLFTDYIAQAGQDNYFGQSVQAGVRIGF